jgi:hypothetical protein
MPFQAAAFAPSSGVGLPPARSFATCSLASAMPTAPAFRARCSKPSALIALRAGGETTRTPASIADMMQDAGDGVLAGVNAGLKRMAVEVPLPITGGTELDDWPGGIGQKYEVCMHACVYVCIHVCIHAYMHACMHACMHSCMHACIFVCMHVCMYQKE